MVGLSGWRGNGGHEPRQNPELKIPKLLEEPRITTKVYDENLFNETGRGRSAKAVDAY